MLVEVALTILSLILCRRNYQSCSFIGSQQATDHKIIGKET
jgi:hypothetical protein